MDLDAGSEVSLLDFLVKEMINLILAPSLDSLQRMLITCENYAAEHNLKFSTLHEQPVQLVFSNELTFINPLGLKLPEALKVYIASGRTKNHYSVTSVVEEGSLNYQFYYLVDTYGSNLLSTSEGIV